MSNRAEHGSREKLRCSQNVESTWQEIKNHLNDSVLNMGEIQLSKAQGIAE